MEPDLSRENGDVKNALLSKMPIKRAGVSINSEFHKVTCGMSDLLPLESVLSR